MRNLREGCLVWLAKEGHEARIESPYQPSLGRAHTGRIFLRIHGHIDYWFVDDGGRGIDGSILMQPLEGNLPDIPALLQSGEAEELRLEIARLRKDITDVCTALNLRVPVYINPRGLARHTAEGRPTLWDHLE